MFRHGKANQKHDSVFRDVLPSTIFHTTTHGYRYLETFNQFSKIAMDNVCFVTLIVMVFKNYYRSLQIV